MITDFFTAKKKVNIYPIPKEAVAYCYYLISSSVLSQEFLLVAECINRKVSLEYGPEYDTIGQIPVTRDTKQVATISFVMNLVSICCYLLDMIVLVVC